MAILALAKNNKNQYRKFPFKQNSTCTAEDGFILSDKIIVNCSITSIFGLHNLFIKQIFYKDNIARIALASKTTNAALGIFEGEVFQDFTTLTFTPFLRFISGTLTIGSFEELSKIPRTLYFSESATEIEESTIFCYTRPGVTSVRDKKENEIRGNVNYGTLVNLTRSKPSSQNTHFKVTNPQAVFNLADKSTRLGNCRNPVIKNINGVVPYPTLFDTGTSADINNGNIYIFGVLPIAFYGIDLGNNLFEEGTVNLSTENITLDTLCTERNKIIPPTPEKLFFTSIVNLDKLPDGVIVDYPIRVLGKLETVNELPSQAFKGDAYVIGLDLYVADTDSPSPEEWLNVGDFINQYYTKPALEEKPANALTSIPPYTQPARLAGNFYVATRPEFYYWPQFVKPEHYNEWRGANDGSL
jgi:hypothetical protein